MANTALAFGRHKGKTVNAIWIEDRGYITWLAGDGFVAYNEQGQIAKAAAFALSLAHAPGTELYGNLATRTATLAKRIELGAEDMSAYGSVFSRHLNPSAQLGLSAVTTRTLTSLQNVCPDAPIYVGTFVDCLTRRIVSGVTGTAPSDTRAQRCIDNLTADLEDGSGPDPVSPEELVDLPSSAQVGIHGQLFPTRMLQQMSQAYQRFVNLGVPVTALDAYWVSIFHHASFGVTRMKMPAVQACAAFVQEHWTAAMTSDLSDMIRDRIVSEDAAEVVLNPTLGRPGMGADADLIVSYGGQSPRTVLYAIKVSKHAPQRKDLLQLLGYAALWGDVHEICLVNPLTNTAYALSLRDWSAEQRRAYVDRLVSNDPRAPDGADSDSSSESCATSESESGSDSDADYVDDSASDSDSASQEQGSDKRSRKRKRQ